MRLPGWSGPHIALRLLPGHSQFHLVTASHSEQAACLFGRLNRS
jgi:hypothetical protein